MPWVSNWGRYPKIKAEISTPTFKNESISLIQSKNQIINRGLGRSYGDASLGKEILSTVKLNNIIEFNKQKGSIRCEAGVSLEKILNFIVPKGWFLPVTPGTKFITVGGAIASNIHGKNHHKEGCFSDHLIDFDIILEDGQLLHCSRTENADLFEASCGGLGLTGMIVTARFYLKPIETTFIRQTTLCTKGLEEVFYVFEKNQHANYSVAWIDCLQKGKKLGKGVMLLGEHALSDQLPSKIKKPFQLHTSPKVNLPILFFDQVLNPWSVKTYNHLYYKNKKKEKKERILHYNSYFYPLDNFKNWNKFYGKKGLLQYQFVLPIANSFQGLKLILKKIEKSGLDPYLAVLKLMGSQRELMAFPMKGYTLALDFPIKKGVFKLLEELDAMVHDLGGRIYLAKDARMSAHWLLKGYPLIYEFMNIVQKYNPSMGFRSHLGERLGIFKDYQEKMILNV
ncbi:FAD-binding oxidoreductase [Xanthovirga aplysinae]|uniref:FAD-binding oxidoreductase n=1 Tax=Xanthovirga aplysinae TaxID=2529853 RepID=UPI0012BD6533|nr:FAD-binding oxidoreductase [Xanthovirga aplysinae]MTI33405.1 FAD-binding oxidoreductase [Xanthovirga aplysinae]